MIQELRREISAVDREIAKLLCTRFRLVGEIQRVKAAQRMPAEDLSRESEVLENVKGSAPERFRNDPERNLRDGHGYRQTSAARLTGAASLTGFLRQRMI